MQKNLLPIEFLENLRQQMGSEAEDLFKALQQEPVTSIRLNDKAETLTLETDFEDVPWNDDGLYLSERPQFTLDPLFHAGCYYVQEASSMFVQQVLEQYVHPDSIVLDLCAAPGGKSTLISQFLGPKGLLVSNEVVRQRVFILSENIQKWGNGNVVVTHNDSEVFGERLPNLFDCVLVDAPCSGEGMFRKDDEAVADWSRQNVRMCVERQRQILENVWDSLKPGGVLIYSTCTFNRHEDEENAQWIANELGADVLPVRHDPAWGITETHTGYHFYPHKTRGEGFYICVLRKHKAQFTPCKIKVDRKEKVQLTEEIKATVTPWLQHPEEWALRVTDRFVTAYSAQHKELIDFLSSQLTCLTIGFGLAEQRGKGYAPQHSLAMAKALRKEAFPQVELTLEQALAYLRTEALSLENLPLGSILVLYQGVPLGFVKNVGNRCNNLYPNEWRIRKL